MNLLEKRLWGTFEMREEVAEMSMAGVLRGAEVGSWPPPQDGSGLVSAIGDGVRERRLPTWLQTRSFYLNKEERAQFIHGHP